MKMPKIEPEDPAKPKSTFEKIVSTTPIALTVIATVLAGLSSSSMNLGQYYRGLATQAQSKAGDQWNLFQAKKLRQSGIDNTIAILSSMAKAPAATMPVETGEENVTAALRSGTVPQPTTETIQNEDVNAALKAIENHRPDAEIKDIVKKISDEDVQKAIDVTERNYAAFDAQVGQINSALDRMGGTIEKQHPEMMGAFSLARLRFSSKRYAADAKYNQTPGDIYEIEVRRNTVLSERYRIRSKQFFWAMLAAQAGVMIATFSIAMRQKSLLWGVASAAGLIALSAGVYVYLFV